MAKKGYLLRDGNDDAYLEKQGEATGVNLGVASYRIVLQASDWQGSAVDTELAISNYQPVGGDGSNFGLEFDDVLRFLINTDTFVAVPTASGGATFTYGASIAASGKGTDIVFEGGSAASGNNDGGDITIRPGSGFGSGDDGSIILNGPIEFGGAMTYNVTTVNAATYDLLISDYILHVTYTDPLGSNGAVTSLTLPTAQTVAGRTIIIKDAGGNASVNNITIDTEGAETIDGSATLVINGDYDSETLYSDGSNWFRI